MQLTFPSYLLEHQLPTAESAKYNTTALLVHVNVSSQQTKLLIKVSRINLK